MTTVLVLIAATVAAWVAFFAGAYLLDTRHHARPPAGEGARP
ncbi:hypothetical protein ACKI1J_15740 [Streptomyces scabiei]